MPEPSLDKKINDLRKEYREAIRELEERQNERMDLVLKPIANALTNLSESTSNFQVVVGEDIKGILKEQQSVAKRLDAHCTAEETASKLKLESEKKKEIDTSRFRWVIGTILVLIGLMLTAFNLIKGKHEGWLGNVHDIVLAKQTTEQAVNK
jgi:hypothetical protein